jgi:PqqD family protein of HPr-rel-A system
VAEPRYRAPAAEALRIAPLDELTAIFHRPSAQTHLVVSPVPEMLEALGEEGVTAAELLARLGERYDMPDADAAALVARLDELVETGLVERV